MTSLILAVALMGQCEAGQCRVAPVRNTVAVVVRVQPVRSVAAAVALASCSVSSP